MLNKREKKDGFFQYPREVKSFRRGKYFLVTLTVSKRASKDAKVCEENPMFKDCDYLQPSIDIVCRVNLPAMKLDEMEKAKEEVERMFEELSTKLNRK